MNMDRPLAVTVTVKVLPDRTVITSQVKGTGDDGQPFTSPLLKAEDTSPRATHQRRGAAVRRIYPGDDNAGTWVRNVVIRDGAGQVRVRLDERPGAARAWRTPPRLPKPRWMPCPRPGWCGWSRGGARASGRTWTRSIRWRSSRRRPSCRRCWTRTPDPVLLFPEDRTRPVVMPDFLPQKWALEGPQDRFRGECQPSEYYCWQIGVYAAREEVTQLSLEYTDVRDAAGQIVIRGQDITCFNLEGTNNRGERFTKEFTLGKGMVRPLWIGMMVPDDAKGELQGEVQVQVNDQPAQTIRLVLKVDGPVIPNHGDDEPWRHSRLRWLNSTLGLDDNILPLPFTPVKRQGTTLEILNRAIDLGRPGPAGEDRQQWHGRAGRRRCGSRRWTPTAGRSPSRPAERAVEMENPSRVIEAAQARCRCVEHDAAQRALVRRGDQLRPEPAQREGRDSSRTSRSSIPMRKELAKYFVGLLLPGRPPSGCLAVEVGPPLPGQRGLVRRVSRPALGIALLGEHDYWDLSEPALGRAPAVDQRREGGRESHRGRRRGGVAGLHRREDADGRCAGQAEIPALRHALQAAAPRSLEPAVLRATSPTIITARRRTPTSITRS